MSELDEKKLRIAFLEKLFFVFLAAAFAIVAWIAVNYGKPSIDSMVFEMAYVALLADSAVVVILFRMVNVRIREVRDL